MRGTGSDSYALNDHFVPQNFTAGRDNPDELREKGPLYQFTSGMIYAMSFAHVSMGIAKGAFDAFIEIARDKVPRGAKGTLRENNVIQSQVSQCEAKLKSSRAYLRGVIAEMWDEARTTGAISADYHPQLRLAATWAINQSRDIVAAIYQAAGVHGDFREQPAGAPDARHPRRHPAGPGPPGPFRDGRPDHDGPAAGRTDVPVGIRTAKADPVLPQSRLAPGLRGIRAFSRPNSGF